MRLPFLILLPVGLLALQPDPELMAEYNRAWRLSGQFRKQEAAALLQQIIAKDNTFHRAYWLIAESDFSPLQPDEAESYFQELLKQDSRNALAHYGLARVAQLRGLSSRADQHYLDCAPYWPCYVEIGRLKREAYLRQRIAEEPLNIAAHLGLGVYLNTRTRPSEARQALATALRLARANSDPDLEADVLDALAQTYAATLGDHDDALSYAREALAAYERLQDEPRIVQALYLIARISTRSGDHEGALLYYQRALSLVTDAGHIEGRTELLMALGAHFRALGEHEKALEYYGAAARYCQRLPSRHYCHRSVPSGLAGVYALQGATQRAIEYYKCYYEVAQRQQIPYDIGAAWRGLGDVYLETGDYARALECHMESTGLFRAAGYLHTAGAGEGRIGLAYQRLGDYRRAREQLEKALQSARKHEDADGQERTLGNLGRLALETGDHKGALQYLQQALALSERTRWLPFRASTLIGLGRLYAHLGQSQQALEHLETGLDTARRVKINHLQATALTAIAREHLRAGKLQQAEEVFRTALTTAEQTGLRETAWQAHQGLGETLETTGQHTKALSHYEAAIQILESVRSQVQVPELKASFLARRTEPYELVTALLYRLHQSEPHHGYDRQAFHYAERGRARAFLDTLAESKAQITRHLTPEQRERQTTLEAAVSRASASLLRETSVRNKEALQEAEHRLDEFWLEIRKTNPRYAELAYPEPDSPEQVQTGLKEDGATLVQYALGEHRSFVWVLTPQSLIMKALPRRAEIERQVRRYRRILTAHPKGSEAIALYQQYAQRMYVLLIRPIERHLAGERQLVIVPDGILHYLPFETLQGRRRLVEDYTISYVPSASVLGSLRQRQKQRQDHQKILLAFADPFYGNSAAAGLVRSIYEQNGALFSPLPHAREEVTRIAALYPKTSGTTYFGAAATETALKKERLSDYRWIHFATHAVVDEKAPARSGIVLSLAGNRDGEDGVLQMREILNLSLRADLVVLSACQTGLGQLVRGEGMVGLTRAFLYADASRLAVSLWKVNDASTAELMKQFYGKLKSGIPPAEALRRARLEMLHSGIPAYQHPYFWSPFVMVGLAR
jgi:CHAT domain-containing protein/uncharacterized protein HemY